MLIVYTKVWRFVVKTKMARVQQKRSAFGWKQTLCQTKDNKGSLRKFGLTLYFYWSFFQTGILERFCFKSGTKKTNHDLTFALK
jgi:hypothetical protein